MVLVVTGPIASGRSTLARAIACELRARGTKAAAVELDLIYEMLDPARASKTDVATWTQARRMAAWLTTALLAEGVAVVVEGEFLTAAERAESITKRPRELFVRPRRQIWRSTLVRWESQTVRASPLTGHHRPTRCEPRMGQCSTNAP